MMKSIQEDNYQTAGALNISRVTFKQSYKNATTELIEALNSQKGVLLSSSFEFPGRYTRWDIGFVNPPLMITSVGRTIIFAALNARGRLLLEAIREILEHSVAIDTVESDADSLKAILRPVQTVVFEEDRSRQITVFSVLREVIAFFKNADEKYLGLYGAFGYELAFQFEQVNLKMARTEQSRDLVLYLPDEILVVDHRKETAFIYRYEFEFSGKSTSALERSGSKEEFQFAEDDKPEQAGDHVPGEFAATVTEARKYFARGDLFEAVPGQLFFEKCIDRPSDIFRRLQTNNPAPYGALINLGEQEYLVAASPEMYVRVRGERVETCPISGTIARGKDAIEDAENIKTLLNSLKDESELSMCTDVDRNDKSRVCVPGSVQVIGRRQLELYSRLIHTVDHVEGKLQQGFDALDAFLSHTWAVTVTGAPKQAAIQFIEDHEKSPRRWYGGAMGCLGFNGDMNTGLTLRTSRIQNGVAEVRAGATLLYDSDPLAEEAETRLKASALLSAISNSYPVDQAYERQSKTKSVPIDILMVDHQDSFVHNLSAYFQESGARVRTVRHELFEAALWESNPDLVVLSPGPGRPDDFNMQETISLCLLRNIPLFGVCLGLQGIVEYFGGKLSQLDYPVHGKPASVVDLKGKMFEGLNSSFDVGRYHSLAATKVPEFLSVCAVTADDGVVMAVEHKRLPVMAVQFHPESILSLKGESGRKLIANVVSFAL